MHLHHITITAQVKPQVLTPFRLQHASSTFSLPHKHELDARV